MTSRPTGSAVGDSSPLRGEVDAKRRVRGALRRAKGLRLAKTDAEHRFWAIVRNRQLAGYKFLRQVPIGRYIVDFVCREAALVVELDGGQHAESAYDEERTRFLNREGYAVLRFWNDEVLKHSSEMSEVLILALDGDPSPGWRYSPADLSPEGGGARGARAATTKQRSPYVSFLNRIGEGPSQSSAKGKSK